MEMKVPKWALSTRMTTAEVLLAMSVARMLGFAVPWSVKATGFVLELLSRMAVGQLMASVPYERFPRVDF